VTQKPAASQQEMIAAGRRQDREDQMRDEQIRLTEKLIALGFAGHAPPIPDQYANRR